MVYVGVCVGGRTDLYVCRRTMTMTQFQADIRKNFVYRMSQKWRTNYLLPYRGCLNVHEKIWKKCFRQKNQLFLLLLLTTI
jgi:hypothetical protein